MNLDALSARQTRSVTSTDVAITSVLALLVVAVFQAVGPWQIGLGAASIVIYPMVWSLIAGTAISAQRIRPVTPGVWQVADGLMTVAVGFLVARLSVTIGPNITVLVHAGPALLLQEVGHLLGTVAVALPLAVALKMGRATVGATFAIDREGSFAIVGDRYGVQSDEYRGVLSMYVFGTVFGAVLIGFVASLTSSMHVFDPQALAMGVGVGSGSMMAAGTAAVASAHPEVHDQVLALAGTSNLITTILGPYVGVCVALPLADRFYRLLTRNAAPATPVGTPPPLARETAATQQLPLRLTIPITIALGMAAATVAARRLDPQIVVGFAVVTAVTLAALGLARLTRGRVQSIVWASALGTYLSSPWSPVAHLVVRSASSIDFLSLAAVVLGAAGLGMGRNLPALRRIGWRIVPVGSVALLASFLLATVIAEFTLGRWH